MPSCQLPPADPAAHQAAPRPAWPETRKMQSHLNSVSPNATTRSGEPERARGGTRPHRAMAHGLRNVSLYEHKT